MGVILSYLLRSSVLIRMCSLYMLFEMILSLRLIWTQTTGERNFIVDSTDMSLENYLRESLVLTQTAGKPDSFVFSSDVMSELLRPGGFIVALSTGILDIIMLRLNMDLQIWLATRGVVTMVTRKFDSFVNRSQVIL